MSHRLQWPSVVTVGVLEFRHWNEQCQVDTPSSHSKKGNKKPLSCAALL